MNPVLVQAWRGSAVESEHSGSLAVLDADGKLLHSQFTGELEKGEGYDRKKFFDFLKQWAPPKT